MYLKNKAKGTKWYFYGLTEVVWGSCLIALLFRKLDAGCKRVKSSYSSYRSMKWGKNPTAGWDLEPVLLTPWCRVLLEKLTGLQLVKKFPAFHGIRRFITALTSVRQLSLSWANPILSTYPHRTSWRSVLILSTHLRGAGIKNQKYFTSVEKRHDLSVDRLAR